MRKQKLLFLLMTIFFVLAACSTQVAGPSAEAGVAQPEAEASGDETSSTSGISPGGEVPSERETTARGEQSLADEAAEEMTDAGAADGETGVDGESVDARPTWQQIALVDAATGQPFTLADFNGKAVFVEPMATWCSNCRQQQHNVREARAQLGDDVVFVGLSLEVGLPPEQLATYAQGNGFDWTYAVMSQEMLEALAGEFGRAITSAPSTPHFVIHPDGSFTELATGIHSPEEIVAQLGVSNG